MPGIVQPPLGQTYVFKNISSKILSSGQNNIPVSQPGQEFSLQESQVNPIHLALVLEGFLSVSPTLPPDLSLRATSLNWRDQEWRNLMEMLKQEETKIVFSPNASIVGVLGEPVQISIFVQNNNNVANKTDSEEEVTVAVDSGAIVNVTGYMESPTPGTVRAKFSSGVIVITVIRSTTGNQTLSLSNPKTVGLDVSDTHVIAWS
jgi:hypothetical protein